MCELCKATGKRLQIDHCHESGYVRGLVCAKCNSALRMHEEGRKPDEKCAAFLSSYRPLGSGARQHTPGRMMRVPDLLWQAAQTCAAERGETVGDVVRRALHDYVKEQR